MPRLDGIEATRRILESLPSTRVLMLTTFDDDADAMIAAMPKAVQGEPPLAPAALTRVLERAVQAHSDTSARAGDNSGTTRGDSLTEREREVLALVGAGHSNAEIGATLHLGVTTVKSHIGTVTRKLDLRNRVQAAVVAHRLGLVDDEFRPVGSD